MDKIGRVTASAFSILAFAILVPTGSARAAMAHAGAGSTLDLRAGFDGRYYSEGGKAYLYVELKGVKSGGDSARVPLNISLVLDRSGSMQEENKLGYLKKACETLIGNLRPDDYLSVIAYASDVKTLRKSAPLGQKEIIRKAIEGLTPTSLTNLSGGMLRGFEEAKSTRREKYVNRVLLISDGLANQGVVSVDKLQQIVKAKYREDGVALSAFGLGRDYNEDLMTNLAESGRGNYYFIRNPDEIAGIFAKELNGLASVIAQNAKLKVEVPSGFRVARVYGYDHEVGASGPVIDFNDVFSEETKAVLIELDVATTAAAPVFRVRLDYDDVDKSFRKKGESLQLALAKAPDEAAYRNGRDAEVMRNVVLFRSIDNFEKALKQVDGQEWDKAKGTLLANKAYMDESFAKVKPDSVLLKQYEQNDKYANDLTDLRKSTLAERSMYQKSSKVMSYSRKKKR
jgi:Ca-activated chloride channel family protein